MAQVTPPFPVLRLLVPPLRLLTAALWQIVQQKRVNHYRMLEDVVCLITEAIPELLTDTQKSLLFLALKGKDVTDPNMDAAIKILLSDCLCRLEQLFPVPSFTKTALWLDAVLDECLEGPEPENLKLLLTNQNCRVSQVPSSNINLDTEKLLLSQLAKDADPCTKTDESTQGTEALVEAEEDLIEPVVLIVHQEQTCAERGGEQSDYFCDQQSIEKSDSVYQHEKSSIEVTSLNNISTNSQRVAHRCPQCGKCFIYRSQVIRHLRTNRSCGSSVTLLPKTSKNQKDPSSFGPCTTHVCFQCNAVFGSEVDLQSHSRCHRPLYVCDVCGVEFQLRSSLISHNLKHHKEGVSAEETEPPQRLRPHSCSVCQQTFSSQARLLRHLQAHAVEGTAPRYDCRYCDLSFSGVTLLRIHQRSHANRTYHCDKCNKTYGSLSSLKAHRSSHVPDSHYLCAQCGQRFKTIHGLEGHARTHRGERPHCCPYCPKRFTAIASLNVHVRCHTGERPYVCDVCGKGWPSGGDLQKHRRTHTGERPYTCRDCGKSFSISSHLTEHLRIHTGEKPFTCTECGKHLRRKFDLKKHMLTHQRHRPFACSICNKSYTRKTHLNRHVLSHCVEGSDPGVRPLSDEAEGKAD
ncbi:uncharacterized protein ACB058_004534 isoform 1-T1 [Synchiropus picturatus]